jgi:hypothetical protein
LECNKAQKIKALKIWHDYYAAKHSRAAEAKSIYETVAAEQAGEAVDTAPEAASVPTPAAEKPSKKSNKNTGEHVFVDQVAKATGLGQRAAQYEVRLAKMFSNEELDIFVQRGLTKQQIETLSHIPEREKQQEVITLIASGMELSDAWMQTFSTPMVLVGGCGSKGEKTARAEAKIESDSELTDEEWVNTYCSENLAVLGHPEKFKADAILYRRTAEVRAKFRSRVKSHIAKAREAGITGPLCGSMSRLISISHPKDWFFCPECGGAGERANVNEPEVSCFKCNRAGYILRSEKYE